MKSVSDRQSRSFWLKHLHRWHWISSAICLIGMLLFVATGITLNHAADIETEPQVVNRTASLPAPLLAQLAKGPQEARQPLPAAIAGWLSAQLADDVAGKIGEWSEDEVYVSLPRPGGDAWLTIDRASGDVSYELTDRGWIAYFNDLHKGRNAGRAWAWFIDIFAGTALVFCITGLFLLHLHAGNRPTTWPLVALGLVVPLLLAIAFIH
ncbi:PepSY-associated TM helix domain-containing protein [Chitinolyticbacter meiyuanensis]|uniref:PepSY-associated TM helix domain-containing protein n=1 Tax=Chitinolyticbacter meiyuanensis TaxID=682798 RepID=UPI0011E5A663|nr:PepSY-associated TM helix domain-containing protein [Chitinolyticbacter meiyuanensis]